MPGDFTQDYLLDKKVKIFQPLHGYRAAIDAVLLAAMPDGGLHNARILDTGSGTGAVSLCLAHRLQKNNVRITGLELQPELAELSQKSAEACCFDFVKFYQADIREKLHIDAYTPCSFDIVVSNPPYGTGSAPSPLAGKAAAHDFKNFSLERWLGFCLKSLKPFGRLYLVNRSEALADICTFLHGKAGGITVLPVYSKKGQDCKRVLVCAQKDSKAPCRILPPFVMHGSNGKYTPKAEDILRGNTAFNI